MKCVRLVLFLAIAALVRPGLAWPPDPPEAKPSPRVMVDEFLFPQEGALDRNLKVLEALVRGRATPDQQALYGIQLLSAGDYSAARQHCTEALARGFLFEPVYCMAMLEFSDGKLKEAAAFARQAIELRPGSVAPYIVLANVAKTLKDRSSLVKAIEAGRAAVPDRAPFWEWELSRMLEELGDLDGALQCAGVLAGLTPDDPRVFAQAGDWLVRQKRLQEAVSMYRFALSKASWFVPAALALLQTHRAAEEWRELLTTARDFAENPQLDHIRPSVRSFGAEAAAKLFELESAAIESKHGISLTELHSFDAVEPALASEVLLNAARTYMELGFDVPAIPLLRKARSLSPDDVQVGVQLSDALIRYGEYELAASYLEEGIVIQPTSRAYLLLASLSAREGDADRCLEYGSKALELRADYLDALLVRARCLRSARSVEEELKVLQQAVKTYPENLSVLGELAEHYLHSRGGEVQATNYLKRIYNLSPFDFPVCLRIAGLEVSLKRPADAMATYARCLAAIPPARTELRDETYAGLARQIPSVKSTDAVVDALFAACETNHEAACAEYANYTRKKVAARRIKGKGYSPPRRRGGYVGELERLGRGGEDFLVLGLEAPGFDELPLRQKMFLLYMTRAAIAGDDLLYLQNHRHALQIKRLLEQLFSYRKHLPKETAAAIHDYLKYVWVNHGNYDHRSGVKILPRLLTPAALRNAMQKVHEKGARFDYIPGATLGEQFSYLEPTVFDANVEPQLTVTEPGKDIILDSAVNHYDPGITTAMLEKLPKRERNALNVRFAMRGGEVIPRTYRVGGIGSRYFENIVHFLNLAHRFADTGPQKLSIEELIRFYKTGDETWFREHSKNWLKTVSGTDYINGLVEQLKDPRGVIGNFEGMAAFVSDAARVDRLAEAAEYFERRMPWPHEFKRLAVTKPVANVATVLIGTGDMGPVPWAGYNLPNYADIRSEIGSKNVIFTNIMSARSAKDREAFIAEFYLPEYQPLVREWGDVARKWGVYLHEVIGHGSGRPAKDLPDDPRNLLGRSFSALEEARADLIALYFFSDDKLVELGVYERKQRDRAVLAAYAQYFQGFLTLYRRFHGDVVREAHWKGRQLILSYLLKGGGTGAGDYGIKLVDRGGNYYIQITDVHRLRIGLAKLLAMLQVFKSTGDKEAAEMLVDQFGTRFDTAVRDNIVLRAQKISISRQTAFVFPRLEAVRDRKGNILDVKLRHDEDLTAQHLRFSRLQEGTNLE